ncbi:MAG: methyltransferase [Candidatus Aminicenantes bacterium]|nr:methyltransferase [Candidatus Aminicenantes bacterium]
MDDTLRSGETLDDFYRGRVRLIQPKKGYRFATDAPLLAAFVEIRPGDDVCELGTGNGVVAVLLGFRPFRRLTAVEIQPRLADMARRNVAGNGLAGRVEIVEVDLRSYRPGRRFDVVLSNPPYHEKKAGSPCPDREKAIAKHEITCDIMELMRTVSELLKGDGRAFFVYPAAREGEFRGAAEGRGLRPAVVRRIHPRENEGPNLFLAELRFAAAFPGEETVLPPLILHPESGGGFTPEVSAMLEGPSNETRR